MPASSKLQPPGHLASQPNLRSFLQSKERAEHTILMRAGTSSLEAVESSPGRPREAQQHFETHCHTCAKVTDIAKGSILHTSWIVIFHVFQQSLVNFEIDTGGASHTEIWREIKNIFYTEASLFHAAQKVSRVSII